MKIKIKNPFSRSKSNHEEHQNNDIDIEQDIMTAGSQTHGITLVTKTETEPPSEEKKQQHIFGRKKQSTKSEKPTKTQNDEEVKSRSQLERLAFSLLSSRISGLDEFKETYAQSGIPVIFEAYISTGFFVGCIAAVPALVLSLLLELKFLPKVGLPLSIIGSVILAGVVFGITIAAWLSYPSIRRRGFKSKLENQLAYSFGILGVLAAAGMNLDRLFERIATSESNPVLADLAKRFLRNIRFFGLDTETALSEVAKHSPSDAFSKMLGSIAVAHKTTGSIHDLVMFESSRLLQEKRDKLRKTIGSLGVMAELYITLVVVGPIIFIIMMAIFGLLPAGGLPSPISLINLIVFVGIPVLSVMFLLLLDSTVSKA
jgi:Type II secretion system (T2SS), protein F